MTVFLIGLDSASWNILNPLLAEGSLPTLEKVISEGVAASLRSTPLFMTVPAWKSMTSGKNPGKLDMFSWIEYDRKAKQAKIGFDNPSIKDLWNLLSRRGHSCCVINVPMAQVPKHMKGVFVAGFPFSENMTFTFPDALGKVLKGRFSYKISPKNSFTEFAQHDIRESLELMGLRFTVANYILRNQRFDFVMLVVFHLDKIQHHYMDNMEVLRKVWRRLDHCLGELIEENYNPAHDSLFIVSDHGATSLKREFFTNVWLMKAGYLKMKSTFWLFVGLSRILSKLGLTIDKLERLKNSTIGHLAMKLLGRKESSINLLHLFPSRLGRAEIGMLLRRVDFSKSKAVCVGENCIYVLDEKNHGRICAQIETDLRKLRDPISNELMVSEVFMSHEVFSGIYVKNAPDVIVGPAKGYRFYDGLPLSFAACTNSQKESGWRGYHLPKGIFISQGPAMKKATRLKYDLQIYDIAPTILRVLGVPSFANMDGRVIKEIMDPQAPRAEAISSCPSR